MSGPEVALISILSSLGSILSLNLFREYYPVFEAMYELAAERVELKTKSSKRRQVSETIPDGDSDYEEDSDEESSQPGDGTNVRDEVADIFDKECEGGVCRVESPGPVVPPDTGKHLTTAEMVDLADRRRSWREKHGRKPVVYEPDIALPPEVARIVEQVKNTEPIPERS